MKTVERQIRNHEFEIVFTADGRPEGEERLWMADDMYILDGQRVHHDAFMAAIALLSAEAPK